MAQELQELLLGLEQTAATQLDVQIRAREASTRSPDFRLHRSAGLAAGLQLLSFSPVACACEYCCLPWRFNCYSQLVQSGMRL